MKQKSGQIKSILIAIVTTLLIYTFVKYNIPNKNSFNLNRSHYISLAEKTIEEIRGSVCDSAEKEVKDFYKKTSSDYSFTVKDGNDFIPKVIEEFTNTNTVSDDSIYEYVFQNKKYVIFLVLFILFILVWIPYIICVCCRKCFCIPESCSDCIKSFIILALLFSGAIAVCCIIGYCMNFGIFYGIYGTGCSVLKLEEHLVNGDEYKVMPYWIGLTPIIGKLTETRNFIQDLPNKSNQLNQNLTKIKENNCKDFENNLLYDYNELKDKKVSDPRKESTEISLITPVVIENVGPIDDSATILGSINYEFTTFTDESMKILEEVIKVIDLGENTEGIQSQLTDITKVMSDAIDSIDGVIVNNTQEYIDYLDEADSYFRISMNWFFTINLALIICAGLSLLGLLLCGKGKCLLGLAWFFLYIFMIVSLLFGIIFGLSGTIIKDVAYGISYILKKSGNLTIIENEETRGLIDTCLNGNGILAESGAIGLDISFNNSMIDDIYYLEKNLNESKDKLASYELLTASETEKKLDEILKQPKATSPELFEALINVRKYIDYSSENSFISEMTQIFDEWEVNKTDCDGKYTYLPPEGSLRLLSDEENKKFCLVITEWSLTEIEERYNNIISTLVEEPSLIVDKAKMFYTSINNYLKENSELIGEMKEKNTQYKNDFKEIVSSEINILEGIRDTIKPIRGIFNDIVGDNSIFTMLNCGFLKRDLNKLLEQLYNGLGGELKITSNIFIAITVIEGVLTFFTLIIMSRYKDEKDDGPKNINKMMEMSAQSGECQEL